MSYALQDLLALREAGYNLVEAYDNAPAVCCPRCEMEPRDAIWTTQHISPAPSLHDAIEVLRKLLGGGA